jgi:hypothetical protein
MPKINIKNNFTNEFFNFYEEIKDADIKREFLTKFLLKTKLSASHFENLKRQKKLPEIFIPVCEKILQNFKNKIENNN